MAAFSETHFSTDGFQTVHYKHRRRQRKNFDVLSGETKQLFESEYHDIDTDKLKLKIQQCREELLGSEFYTGLLGTLEKAVSSVLQTTQCNEKGKTVHERTVSQHSASKNNFKKHNICQYLSSLAIECHRDETGDSSESDLSLPQELSRPILNSQRMVHTGNKHKHRACLKDTKECVNEPVCSMTQVEGTIGMLVYGLGNFASCTIARYQLSLILALRQQWKCELAGCYAYDPQFTEVEKQILTDYGFSLIRHNEEGKRGIRQPTLAIMLHCGKALFNNFLWANWSPLQLQQLVLIGNSFSSMLQSLPDRVLKQQLQYITMIQPHSVEMLVVNNFPHTDVFNDTSVHWFPLHCLQLLAEGNWLHAPEPVYDRTEDHIEIILATNKCC